jgi:hypothetical protein
MSPIFAILPRMVPLYGLPAPPDRVGGEHPPSGWVAREAG